jgi:Base plate wedge protein 53
MPRFFNYYPKLLYTSNGTSTVITDLMTRPALVGHIFDDASLYYQYDIQDGDTPEMIASKYYGDAELHWAVMIPNNIVDPFYDWPMTFNQFSEYIVDKYGSQANALATIHHYEKVVETTDGLTGDITINNYEVDYNTYINVESTTVTLTSPIPVTIQTYGEAVDCFTYEDELNESKRTIYLIRSELIDSVKTQFRNLMSS